MATKYIDENDDTIELDNSMLLKSVGLRKPEPHGGGSWKMVGYIEIEENEGSKKYSFCDFRPGCCLLFLLEYQRNGWGTDDRFRGPDQEAFRKDDGEVRG